jgi:hypothetical protein
MPRSRRFERLLAFALCSVLVGDPFVFASDPYESVQDIAPAGDDDPDTNVTLVAGLEQHHDLDQAGGPEDQDWMALPTVRDRSYEARVSASNIGWALDPNDCLDCATLARVDAAGNVLTGDIGVVDEGTSLESYARSVRWIQGPRTAYEFLRVQGGTFFTENANSIYSVRFWDTTYAIPRWNNSNGQSTVFLINSLISSSASVRVDFYSAAGALLATQSFTLNAHGLNVLSTSTLPALAGLSGHAYVVHTAGYGGLAGKAVALEPATGFTFDTPMVPIPN